MSAHQHVPSAGYRGGMNSHLTKVQVAGIIFLAAAVAGYFMPHLFFAGSVAQVRGICSSSAGAVAQGLNATAASACSQASAFAGVLALLGVAGVLMLVVPALRITRKRT
jgi:uncharacterized membrane protein